MDQLGYGIAARGHFEAYEPSEYKQLGRKNWPLLGGNSSRRLSASMRHNRTEYLATCCSAYITDPLGRQLVLVHPGPRVDSRRVLPEVLNDPADCP